MANFESNDKQPMKMSTEIFNASQVYCFKNDSDRASWCQVMRANPENQLNALQQHGFRLDNNLLNNLQAANESSAKQGISKPVNMLPGLDISEPKQPQS